MYKGGLSIIAWPLFNDIAWFEKLSYIKSKLDNQESKYENARTFLQKTKVIMAKLKICDWSSLNESLIQIRVATLKRLLPIAVFYGMEQRDPIIEPLVNHDSEILIDSPIDFLVNENPIKLLPDNKDESFIQFSEYLRNYFEETVQSRKGSHDDDEWFSEFYKFLKDIIKRRTSRVQNWYEQNTAKFPKDNSDIIDGRYALNQKIEELTRLWTLCGLTCHKCGLKCIKHCGHKENHDCLTDHKCHFLCHFTEAHDDSPIPECRYKAGHGGKHVCDKISHLCNEPCELIDKSNCHEKCSKVIGHDDGEHLCQSKRNHHCGKDCSLSTRTIKGDYRCSNKCTIPYEEEHDLQRCENKICPIQCPIPSCRERCQSDDHFHALSKVDHFCGNEHHCQELCEYDGICHIAIEPKKQEETYKGKVRGTSITYTKYIQVSEKSRCIKKIPPNKFEHAGKHMHSEEKDAFHFCDKKCQFCEYYCTLPYGHPQIIHETKHGSMSQTEFTGEDDEFEYAKYNLRVGDQGIFVLCNLFCKELGRHRHIDYCKNVKNCELGDQGRDIEHIEAKVSPNPDQPKDFISHKLFWERTCFKDPYTVQEQEEFTKCDYECPDEEHRKTGFTGDPPTKSFCKSKLFHAKLRPTKPKNDNGYISFDGHHFGCKNPYTAYHIIFVLDRSFSMSDEDIKPNPNFPIYNDLTKKHNNRIGAVYQAVYIFMNTHKNCVKRTSLDNISLILFDQEIHTYYQIIQVIVPFEYKDLTDLEDLLNLMLQHESYGGTSYNNAIQKAGSLIETYFDPTKVNVIIFLSDGECGTPTNQLHDICKRNKEKGYLIKLAQ
ncbi:hypothetical protein RclHR1_11700001 [Rhizophagus clarus]|uniref:VWFA domain-containing protein n=1 Tax=Rhizophagus clarus TaxID=94130 RepID=A0A2Z6QK87_9GLOM|nr:hypothetical protein RclHR1_11700001 [Rhizophagus clarus]